MGEQGFSRRAAIVLDRLESGIEHAADAAGVDIEISRSGNVIELEFDDGTRFVINSHEAAGEIWLAARSGGYHFKPGGSGDWVDGRTGSRLVDTLGEQLSAQAGVAVDLSGLSLSEV